MGCSASQENTNPSPTQVKKTLAKQNGVSIDDISIDNKTNQALKKTPPPGTTNGNDNITNKDSPSQTLRPRSVSGGGRAMSMSFSKSNSTFAKFNKITNTESPMIQLDVSKQMKLLTVEGSRYHYQLNYCYCSQRGYYPRALDKANQDSYLIGENILDNNTCHVFGIFDGHGEYGDKCAFYCADKVCNIIHWCTY